MPPATPSEWAAFLDENPQAHLLQTSHWGELKAGFGWHFVPVVTRSSAGSAGALVLFRRIPLGLNMAYIPKGPPGWLPSQTAKPPWAQLWAEIDQLCRRKRAVFLKVESDSWEITGQTRTPESDGNSSPPPGFRPSLHTIQPPRTLIVDLQGEDEQVLGRMKQKTRYNIRLALKKGVVTQPSADVEAFYRLMHVTGQRDGFGVHTLSYYQRAYELFYPRGACELLMAEFQGEPLAGLMVFMHGRRAWYLYGGSVSDHRDRMPNYLIQWEAMRWARARGCTEYDLWGVPDEPEETLEAHFTEKTGGLWGVYRFKRGFGGELRRAAGPWDRIYQPILYAFYSWWAKNRAPVN